MVVRWGSTTWTDGRTHTTNIRLQASVTSHRLLHLECWYLNGRCSWCWSWTSARSWWTWRESVSYLSQSFWWQCWLVTDFFLHSCCWPCSTYQELGQKNIEAYLWETNCPYWHTHTHTNRLTVTLMITGELGLIAPIWNQKMKREMSFFCYLWSLNMHRHTETAAVLNFFFCRISCLLLCLLCFLFYFCEQTVCMVWVDCYFWLKQNDLFLSRTLLIFYTGFTRCPPGLRDKFLELELKSNIYEKTYIPLKIQEGFPRSLKG